jgi:uncharacterized membrane protein
MTLWHLFIPIVALLGAWTTDRFVHLAWAGTFFVVFLVLAAGYKAVASDKSLVVRYWFLATHPKKHSHFHGLPVF